MTEFATTGGQGAVAFAAKVPGQIMAVEVQPGRGYLVHRHGFLCATQGVELTMALQRSLGAGIFGGEGFVLQRLSGTCSAWVELGGEIVSHDLGPGETLLVHPGHVGMFEESVSFDITTIRGITKRMTIPVKLRQLPRPGDLSGAVFETNFQIDRSDFGLNGSPRWNGFKVSISKNVHCSPALR